MSGNVPGPGWAAELRGETFDLDDLRVSLSSGGDPWVEDYHEPDGVILLLRSSRWKDTDKGGAVTASASALLRRINAAHLLVYSDAEPIALGRVMRFAEGGKIIPVLIAGTGHFTLKGMRARGHISTAGTPQRYQTFPIRQWLSRSEQDPKVWMMLDFITGSNDWFELYKASEMVVDLLGGGEKEVVKRLKDDGPKWKLFMHTANSLYRHAPIHQPPSNPMEFAEARAFLLDSVRRLFPVDQTLI